MRYLSGKHPIVSIKNQDSGAETYLDRLPTAIRFWLDPRLFHRVDVEEVAAEIVEVLTTRSDRWRTDERVSVNSLRVMALSALKRIQSDYLGAAAVQFPPLVMRLTELPRVDATRLQRVQNHPVLGHFYSARLAVRQMPLQ